MSERTVFALPLLLIIFLVGLGVQSCNAQEIPDLKVEKDEFTGEKKFYFAEAISISAFDGGFSHHFNAIIIKSEEKPNRFILFFSLSADEWVNLHAEKAYFLVDGDRHKFSRSAFFAKRKASGGGVSETYVMDTSKRFFQKLGSAESAKAKIGGTRFVLDPGIVAAVNKLRKRSLQ